MSVYMHVSEFQMSGGVSCSFLPDLSPNETL